MTLLGLKIETSPQELEFLYEEFQIPGPEDFADFLSYSREFEFIHNTLPYPTVFCYNFYHARGLLARGVPFFLTKILRFSAKKVKSANGTVFNLILF